MKHFETVDMDNDMDIPPPPPTYETIVLYYEEYSALITAARELNRILRCELDEANDDTDTIRWEYNNSFDISNMSSHAHANMINIEFEDKEEVEHYNGIVCSAKKIIYLLLTPKATVLYKLTSTTPYHLLTTNKRTKLMNGFRYIHELLSQHHN